MPRCDIRKIQKKIDELGWPNLLKYEQKYAWSWARDRADILAQKYAKDQAFSMLKKGSLILCKSCPKQVPYAQCNGSHWIDKGAGGTGNYRCRWAERNIHCCCIHCNAFNKEEHHNNLTLHMIKSYGLTNVDDWLSEVYKTHSIPDYFEIMEIVKDYETKISLLINTQG